jgi:hypothetical protein
MFDEGRMAVKGDGKGRSAGCAPESDSGRGTYARQTGSPAINIMVVKDISRMACPARRAGGLNGFSATRASTVITD